MANLVKQRSQLLVKVLEKDSISEKKKQEAAVKVLLSTIELALQKTGAAQIKLEDLALKLSALEGAMLTHASTIKN